MHMAGPGVYLFVGGIKKGSGVIAANTDVLAYFAKYGPVTPLIPEHREKEMQHQGIAYLLYDSCLLYTSDAADE